MKSSHKVGERFFIDEDGNAELGNRVRINAMAPDTWSGTYGQMSINWVPWRLANRGKGVSGSPSKGDPNTPWFGWLPPKVAEDWVAYLNQADLAGLVSWDLDKFPYLVIIRD